MYSSISSGYQAAELAHTLLAKDINPKRVCRIQPLSATKNATFLVDLDDVLFSDLKADDLGTGMLMEQSPHTFHCLPME